MIYKKINYARECLENKQYDMLLDALDDIEHQARQTVSRAYHEEMMIAKNIEMKMIEYNLIDSVHERVTLISQLKRAEKHIKEVNPSFKDRYYSAGWAKYED